MTEPLPTTNLGAPKCPACNTVHDPPPPVEQTLRIYRCPTCLECFYISNTDPLITTVNFDEPNTPPPPP